MMYTINLQISAKPIADGLLAIFDIPPPVNLDSTVLPGVKEPLLLNLPILLLTEPSYK